jgi:hypothetical protein
MTTMKKRVKKAYLSSKKTALVRRMKAKGDTQHSVGKAISGSGPKGGDPSETRVRKAKATTFRLDASLQVGLVVLGGVLKQPLNRLVNEAVRGFLEKRSAEIEADLERTLQRLKAYRKQDPRFESAIDQFVEAEASFGRDDPLEGRPRPAAGPAQTMVHELLRG